MTEYIYLCLCITIFALLVPWASAAVEIIRQDEEQHFPSQMPQDTTLRNPSSGVLSVWEAKLPTEEADGSINRNYQPNYMLRQGPINLQDLPTNSTWVGPQSGTSGIGWLCITSDSSGVNLAAGSKNAGMVFVIILTIC